ncbi:MAG: TIGR02281 family clan AA aspartic protease [Herbaspirillum sp.]
MRLTHLTSYLPAVLVSILSLLPWHANATEINVVGVFPGKAVLVIDHAQPKTYAVGATLPGGASLDAVGDDSATIKQNGKRKTIGIGTYFNQAPTAGNAQTVLQADSRGHFFVPAQINGSGLQMLVDTGATLIALPATDARRLGINYLQGQRGMVNTANGKAPVYRVKLDTVRIGDIVLNQVDAVVQEAGLPYALLGMSFLNRTEMHRDGEQMTLTKRF